MTNRQKPDEVLDRAVEQIRAGALPQEQVDAIAARVWARLAESDASNAPEVDEEKPIRSCEDYQELIPAFVAGSLSKSRRLLVESHTRECLPCRKALKAARTGVEESVSHSVAGPGRRPQHLRWAMAAALVAAVGLGAYALMGVMALEGQAAVVAASDGQVFRLVEGFQKPLETGAAVDLGERVRTGPGESAVLRLEDGSTVEVRERSWLAIRANRRGTTIDLERGSVIVQAAPQRDGHLYVATGDCLVSVTGTIFSVNHGTKGSRVSVIEGEVVVDAAGHETILHPGMQTTTHASLAMIPVSEEIAWSRDIDDYIELLQELSALRQALEDELPRPDLRYSSRLMSMVPSDTAFYIALPNLAETIAEADRILREHVASSRMLSEWWADREELQGFAPTFDRMTQHLAEFGGYLGEEVVITAGLGSGTGEPSPLVLAELRDAAGLRQFVEEQMALHSGEIDGAVVFVDESGAASSESGELFVWLGDETLVAAPDLAALRAALGAMGGSDTGFAATRFGQRVADAYEEGAGVVIAADIARFADSGLMASESDGERAALDASGLLDAEHFLLEQKWVGGQTQHRAVLAFEGPRQGMAAWLAAPAPMGALDYISPEAKFVAAAVLVDPSVMFDDVLRIASSDSPEAATDLESLEAELGFSVRDDIAVAFGGEIAVAIDGPLLPEPSWKAILEVYDTTRVELIMAQLVTVASAKLVENGKEPIELVSEESGGQTYWSISGDQPFHFTFAEGYMIVAPNRGLLDRALRYRQSGYTIGTSTRFRSLLPTDGRDNFSAVFYQDALSLLEPLAEVIASQELTEEQRAAIEALTQETGPTLGYAYGETDRILFAASGTMSLLDAGLPGLLGLGMSFDMDSLFREIMTRGHAVDDAAQAGAEI
jgi:ferric-dicitrate binding protein FerR (iron transport regulator)